MQFFTEKPINSKKFYTNTSKLVLITICAIFLLNFHPKTAHAGLFSFLTGDTASAKTQESQNVPNSQNMLVLQAVVNNDPNPNKSSSDIPTISSNALLADVGPSGLVVDDDDQENTQISLYVVHEGDSLAKIAKMFDVTVNTIIWANDLDRNPVLQKDQKLIILPISGIKYTVKSGDTIKGIVNKYKSDLNEVLKFNDLTISSMISPGDVIIIPDAEPVAAPVLKSSTSKKIALNPVHDANGPFYPGYYVRPIDGGHKSQGLHGYNGIDLADSVGTPIHASASGIVIRSTSSGAWNGGYGNYVIISHDNGTQTLYAHTQRNYVSVGDHVEQGQMIARIGMTGKTTGPHVHFEIRGAKNPF
jgi:murein DD-endopeptidase MepM/ murein hydrolase activator NlpD